MAKNDTQRPITNKKSHCQLQWEEARNGRKNIFMYQLQKTEMFPQAKLPFLDTKHSLHKAGGAGAWVVVVMETDYEDLGVGC